MTAAQTVIFCALFHKNRIQIEALRKFELFQLEILDGGGIFATRRRQDFHHGIIAVIRRGIFFRPDRDDLFMIFEAAVGGAPFLIGPVFGHNSFAPAQIQAGISFFVCRKRPVAVFFAPVSLPSAQQNQDGMRIVQQLPEPAFRFPVNILRGKRICNSPPALERRNCVLDGRLPFQFDPADLNGIAVSLFPDKTVG